MGVVVSVTVWREPRCVSFAPGGVACARDGGEMFSLKEYAFV
jgi:hypothetical protein